MCHLHSPCCLCHLLSSPLRLASRTGWERSHPLASYSVDWGTRAGARAPAAALGRKESKRRASTWQQVIMPDLQRQSEASIMPVGLELATCHSSGQRGLLDAHRLLTATGSCVLKLTTENRRVEACPEPGESGEIKISPITGFDFLEPFWTVKPYSTTQCCCRNIRS